MRVIHFVEERGSRREAAEQFDVSVSSAIRWVQRFRGDGISEPMPRGGAISPLEKYRERIFALLGERPDPTLREIVAALAEQRIPVSRSALSRFFVRHGFTYKKSPQAAERERALSSLRVRCLERYDVQPLRGHIVAGATDGGQRRGEAAGPPQLHLLNR